MLLGMSLILSRARRRPPSQNNGRICRNDSRRKLEVEDLLDLAAVETRSDPVVFVPQMGLVVVQAFQVFQGKERN